MKLEYCHHLGSCLNEQLCIDACACSVKIIQQIYLLSWQFMFHLRLCHLGTAAEWAVFVTVSRLSREEEKARVIAGRPTLGILSDKSDYKSSCRSTSILSEHLSQVKWSHLLYYTLLPYSYTYTQYSLLT